MKHDDYQFEELAAAAFTGEPAQNEIVKQLKTIRNALISASYFGNQPVQEQLKQCQIILVMLLQTAEGSLMPNLFSFNELMSQFFPSWTDH